MQFSTRAYGQLLFPFALLGLILLGGCSSSNEPVPVDLGEDDIAAYEAAMEGAEGGYEDDAGNDER